MGLCVCVLQRLIETAPFGEDAETISQQILSHNKFHSSVQRSLEVDRARDELVCCVHRTHTHANANTGLGDWGWGCCWFTLHWQWIQNKVVHHSEENGECILHSTEIWIWIQMSLKWNDIQINSHNNCFKCCFIIHFIVRMINMYWQNLSASAAEQRKGRTPRSGPRMGQFTGQLMKHLWCFYTLPRINRKWFNAIDYTLSNRLYTVKCFLFFRHLPLMVKSFDTPAHFFIITIYPILDQ